MRGKLVQLVLVLVIAAGHPELSKAQPSAVAGPVLSAQASPPQAPSPQTSSSPQLLRLTLPEAEAMALRNNPQISVYRLLALASHQITREAKSSYYPTTYGSVTAVEPRDGSRIGAGALNNPVLYERFAYGVTLSQLITDFGRTSNLVAGAALRAKAADMNAAATAAQIRLAVDQAFYNALQAGAELKVAEQTVHARQVVSDQITTLFNNKLKSELDVSFANANLAQAKLLLLDAQNLHQAAFSTLSLVLGYTSQQGFDLVDEENQPLPPPDALTPLIDQALSNRPEIAAQNYELQAAQHYQKAERDLLLPDIRVMGTVGQVPSGAPQVESWYGGIGVNVNIPIFNGFLYPARSREASLRAQAAEERLRDLRNNIANDVRTTWLNTQTAYQRMSVTQQFVDQSNLAVDLAQTRYNLGLGSIVELSQAQLQQTQAQIQFAAARYQYQIERSVLRFHIASP